jgi:hypothetical protein
MTAKDAISANRNQLIDAMLATANRDIGTPESGVRQFIVGFVGVLEASADGDHGPRDEYLAAVIPALRSGGMPLTTVVDGMLRVSMAASAVLPREHLEWLVSFCADYSRRMLELWERP